MAGANADAMNCWTPNILGTSANRLQRSTVVGNQDVDARVRANVGCSPRGQQTVGAGIANRMVKIMKGVAPAQEPREIERDETGGMDAGGLEASQPAHTTQEEEPVMRQHLQQQPMPKQQLKLQPKHHPTPKAQ